MSQVVTIGLDIAKSVFQVHAVDAAGAVLLRKRLPRSRMLAFFEQQAPCLIGIEACGSAHYWGRELSRLGHAMNASQTMFSTLKRASGHGGVGGSAGSHIFIIGLHRLCLARC